MREKMDKRMRILAALAETDRELPKREDQLHQVSQTFLQGLWVEGLVDGAALADRDGVGTRKDSRVWWITEKGRGMLRVWEEGLEKMRLHASRYGEKGKAMSHLSLYLSMTRKIGERVSEAQTGEELDKLQAELLRIMPEPDETGEGKLVLREIARRRLEVGDYRYLPRVTGGIPEIVVTPAPAQTPGDKE